jgi:hypothetical protein
MLWEIPNHRRALNLSLLAKAISGIPKSKSVPEFQSLSKIPSSTVTKELLDFLASKGIGRRSNTTLIFSQADKLNLLLLLIQSGCDAKLLSSKLDWRDFEIFTSIILEQTSYYCKTNVHLRKPRFQIDIVGVAGKTALIVDCKHWKDMPAHTRYECATQQRRRARAYRRFDEKIRVTVPIVVTLNEQTQKFVNGVPFIAINRLRAFLIDCDAFQDEIFYI